jgi:hypothetical protein
MRGRRAAAAPPPKSQGPRSPLAAPSARRESFQVMFIPGSLPPWTDARGVALAWPDGPPAFDGDRGWRVARSPATDADGWMYGTSYDRLQYDRPGGRASKRGGDTIRSRLWRKDPGGGQVRREGWGGRGAGATRPSCAGGKSSLTQRWGATLEPAANRLNRDSTHHPQPADAAPAARGSRAAAAAAAVSRAVGAVSSAARQGAASKATVSSVWVQLSELIKSAAERHDASNLLTLDIRWGRGRSRGRGIDTPAAGRLKAPLLPGLVAPAQPLARSARSPRPAPSTFCCPLVALAWRIPYPQRHCAPACLPESTPCGLQRLVLHHRPAF